MAIINHSLYIHYNVFVMLYQESSCVIFAFPSAGLAVLAPSAQSFSGGVVAERLSRAQREYRENQKTSVHPSTSAVSCYHHPLGSAGSKAYTLKLRVDRFHLGRLENFSIVQSVERAGERMEQAEYRRPSELCSLAGYARRVDNNIWYLSFNLSVLRSDRRPRQLDIGIISRRFQDFRS